MTAIRQSINFVGHYVIGCSVSNDAPTYINLYLVAN